MNANSSRGALLAALACLLVGGSFTASSLLGDYPYTGGQLVRYGLACLLLLPWLGRGGTAALRQLPRRQWGRLALGWEWPSGPASRAGAAQRQVSRMARATSAGSSFIGT
ncbi:hypothetical protein [Streptomyces sp. NPDC017988]|uniref:hypothetical protein n=1 Tax=Streptomyces sp. NPDC017988 TaxID=3365025 RepID=UPI003793137A